MGYIRFLGHAAFEIDFDGKRFLIDPWLENPKSPLKPSDIKNVDYIIITHDHGDHLGNAVEIAKKTGATVVSIFEIANYVTEQGVEKAIGANIGGPIYLEDNYIVVLTNATHSSQRGAPTGVVIMKGDKAVYHAGDTGVSYDMKLIGELYKPKVAMLPIGGHFVMGPKEAAKAVELIKPEIAIPMHYETFPVLKGKAEEFIEHVKNLNVNTKVVVLKPGEKIEF